MNQVVEVLENRRTIRKYSDRPIPDEIRDSIIRCAQRAPSGCNFQHYSIINITDKDLQMKLQKNWIYPISAHAIPSPIILNTG